MATEEETGRRFQLSLLDLLVMVLFTGLWLWLFAQVGPKAGNLDDYVVENSSRLQFNAVLIQGYVYKIAFGPEARAYGLTKPKGLALTITEFPSALVD